MSASSRPRRWLNRILYIVSWPWPCEIEPGITVTVPPGSSRTITVSPCAWEVCSMILAKPMPRSRLRAFQVLAEFAAIERIDEAGLERHGTRRHRVVAAQLGSVDLHRSRRIVDQPLDDVGRLGPSRAAIGADTRRVGEDGRDLDMDRGCGVGAGEPA